MYLRYNRTYIMFIITCKGFANTYVRNIGSKWPLFWRIEPVQWEVEVSWVEEIYDMYLFYELRNHIVFTTGVANFIGKILYRSREIQIGDFFSSFDHRSRAAKQSACLNHACWGDKVSPQHGWWILIHRDITRGNMFPERYDVNKQLWIVRELPSPEWP